MPVCPYLQNVTPEVIRAAYDLMGYTFTLRGDYDLNLFGIRTADRIANTFNDCIGAVYAVNGTWQIVKYDATVDPGLKSRTNPVNSRGTAILAPGQHVDAFKFGYHKGKYRAFVQNDPLPLYRDNNRDQILDECGTARYEITGINLHHANSSITSKLVDSWSAGCMVIANPQNFNELLALADKDAANNGVKTFTFTLFTQDQVFPR